MQREAIRNGLVEELGVEFFQFGPLETWPFFCIPCFGESTVLFRFFHSTADLLRTQPLLFRTREFRERHFTKDNSHIKICVMDDDDIDFFNVLSELRPDVCEGHALSIQSFHRDVFARIGWRVADRCSTFDKVVVLSPIFANPRNLNEALGWRTKGSDSVCFRIEYKVFQHVFSVCVLYVCGITLCNFPMASFF